MHPNEREGKKPFGNEVAVAHRIERIREHIGKTQTLLSITCIGG